MDTPQQKYIVNVLYILLIVSTVLGFMPTENPQTWSLILVVVSLIAAYWYRSRDREHGLMYNHMTYLIGTIWNGTTFIIIGMLAAAAWVYFKGDDRVIQQAMEQITNGTIPTEADMDKWMDDYFTDNKSLLLLSSVICVGPGVLYFIYRVANGYARAMKGYRIANPSGWL